MALPPVRPPLRNRFTAAVEAKPDSPEDLVAKGRLLAERNVISFIPALRASVIVMDENVPSIAGIDKWWRTYWNPKGVEWFVRAAAAVSKAHPCPTCGTEKHNRFAYLAGIWVHEVGHCVFRHWIRQEEQGFRDDMKWNIAGDLEMNDDIPGMGAASEKYWANKGAGTAAGAGESGLCPAMCLPNRVEVDPEEYELWMKVGMHGFQKLTGKSMWEMFHPIGTGTPGMIRIPFMMFPDQVPTGVPGEFIKLEEGRIAEVYYELIPDPPKDPNQGQGGQGQGQPGQGDGNATKGMQEFNDHGSGAGGEEGRPWEDTKPGEGTHVGITEQESFAIRREVATRIKEASDNRGTIPAGWQVWADAQLLPPEVRWQDRLRAIARQAIHRVAGEKLNTFRRLSRSSIVSDCKVIKPSQYDVVPTVVIVVDTSGSMGSGSRSRLERALSECEAILKLNKCKAYFLDCDANVYGKAQNVKSLRSAKVNGGGGTDMRIGVLAAKKNKPKPDIIVLLTDGDTPWSSAHDVQGVKMITCICNETDTTKSVPPWMNPIWINKDK